MSKLYENLLKATNNIDDITTEKYGVITKLDGIYCSVKETDNDLEHNNVPILNGANLSVGDKVILGFLNNSIYDVVCYGALDKTVHDDSKQDTLVSGTSIKTINNTSLLGSGNITVGGGGNVPTKTSDLTNDGDDGVNPFVSDDDSRLSDARTPTTHTHLSSDVTDLIDVIYPVGSIYMSVNSTSPATLFGGTWEKIEDTFLLASGTNYATGTTGGEATHTLTTEEMPSHTHTQNAHSHTIGSLARYTISGKASAAVGDGSGNVQNYKTGSTTATNQNTGGGQAHNNMPPYLVVNVWKRTA